MKPALLHSSRRALVLVALVAVAALGRGSLAGAAGSDRPRLGDHWHAALAVDVCGEFLPNAPTFHAPAGRPTSQAGIHTHGDGLIHVHPFTASEAGANATLGKYLEYGGWTITSRDLDLWSGPASAPKQSTWKTGDECPAGEFAGRPGRVVWMVDGKVQRGAPSQLRLKNGQVIVVGFLPKGVELAAPPNALESVQQPSDVTGKPAKQLAAPPMTIDPNAQYTATVTTSLGDIVIRLDAANAPVAVNNFVYLADQKFYEPSTFHRAVRDFVVQGGDPNGNGTGGPGYEVAGEVPHPAAGQPAYPLGSVAMAKTSTAPAGSSGSQFFIVTGASGERIRADYARIGTVTSGLDVAQRIAALAPTSGDGPPTTPVFIYSVTVARG
jgi:cyclophilin family peptidyl-prolyl cis-trans isomerase